jgi:hypothetical protein
MFHRFQFFNDLISTFFIYGPINFCSNHFYMVLFIHKYPGGFDYDLRFLITKIIQLTYGEDGFYQKLKESIN